MFGIVVVLVLSEGGQDALGDVFSALEWASVHFLTYELGVSYRTHTNPEVDANACAKADQGPEAIGIRVEHGEKEDAEDGRVERVAEHEKERENGSFGVEEWDGIDDAETAEEDANEWPDEEC